MAIGQTMGEAKAERLGETVNAPYRHFFPALWVEFWRTPAGVASLGKALGLSVGARLDGSSPQNSMQSVPGWGVWAST